MRIEIEKVIEQGGGVDATLSLGSLDWERGSAIETAPATLKGSFVRANKGYEFDATLAGGVTLECVRCLEAFPLALSFDFHLLFVRGEEQRHAGETQLQPADCDLFPCPEGKVDLEAIAREQIYLHLPLKPICSGACQGLCQVCGDNLNRGPCRCGKPATVRVV
jgi:uncharacterized protein